MASSDTLVPVVLGFQPASVAIDDPDHPGLRRAGERTSAPYDGGNVRDLSLQQIWEHSDVIAFARNRDLGELWGYCKSCYYAEVCRAGCSFTAHSTLGRRGNMPFCYYRASQFKRQGLRERLVHKTRAPGAPYDFGCFELEVEPWPASEAPERPRTRLPVLAH